MKPIYINDFMNKPLKELLAAIESNPKQELESLKFIDLLVDEHSKKELRHGVYMFFDASSSTKFIGQKIALNDEAKETGKLGCLYVGKCSSSHFASRIGLHFGLTPLSRFNTFLRRSVDTFIKKADDKIELNHKAFYEGVVSLKQHKLLLLPTHGLPARLARPIEKLMMELLKPKLNRLSKKALRANLENKMDLTLAEVLVERKMLSKAEMNRF